jgi:hypothetical protein
MNKLNPRFTGVLREERMMGLEPTTFCMATERRMAPETMPIVLLTRLR